MRALRWCYGGGQRWAAGQRLSARARRGCARFAQGPYVGFRSALAHWRFVQPRRRAPHALVFFNDKLGVWEQFEVRWCTRTCSAVCVGRLGAV